MDLGTGIAIALIVGFAAFLYHKKKKSDSNSGSGSGGGVPKDDGGKQQLK
jgi:hypothetical protein